MTRTVDPFDELAAMFLTEADEKPAEDTGDSTPVSVLIELLMVAHLPVRGGLWLTPYADAVARGAGTTASCVLTAIIPPFSSFGEMTSPPNPDQTSSSGRRSPNSCPPPPCG